MSKVYIIGTGPGDEELLTVRAVNVLKECTAVLYDRLVSNNILNYLREDCKVYYCGKEPGCHYKTQDEINDMLIALAKEGHIVGRVKGGDPYVFGRGGEEALALKKENIDFEVVPGITSPISVLNYAGIPITQRAVSQSFHIVTGMSAAELKVDFETLAREKGTLVFMMGLSSLGNIVENLMINGKDKNTPAAVVMRGTSSKQKKVVGTLENIEERVKLAGLKFPCIIVLGEVVALNDKLNWYEKKPLFGYNICITRSKEQSYNLKRNLKNLGAEVTEINSIKIVDTSYNLEDYKEKFHEYEHIILTSVNAVKGFFNYLIENSYDVRNIKAKFSVVGKSTKKALEERGIVPFLVASEFTSEGLFRDLKEYLKKGERVLIPSSSSSRMYLKNEIEALGLLVDRVHIYDTVMGEPKNVRAFEEVDYVLFTSPSTVNNMIEIIGIDKIKEKKAIAIGPQTLKALREKEIDAIMCKKHSEEGFLEEIIDIVKREV